jgi:alpha-mannosidase
MSKIEAIYVVFKTHFDIGFTGLASEVTDSYMGSMLKSVLETCEATSTNTEGHKYIWTMPSWPLKKSLETPDKEMQKQALKLIEEGRIAWHVLPFTTHTDFSGVEEYIRGLGISAELDRAFHKKSIAAKMTDVPGHTRMLPSLLAKAGVKFLHLGCNACVNPPEVPQCFYWKGPDGGGVTTFYTKGGYGTDLIPPDDWEYPVWLALMNTADNKGPHSAEVIHDIVATVAEKLPGTRVVVGTMDDFAHAFLACNPELPVVETDLADSWIHGVGTYPDEVSRVRFLRKAVMNAEGVFSLKTLSEGPPVEDPIKKLFHTVYENILLFDEHTWGLDTKITLLSLHNGKRVYEKKLFLEDKKSSEYKRMEASWAEKAGYVKRAEDAVDATAEILKGFTEGRDNKIAIYNLLSWERGGEADITGLAVSGEALVDSKGKVYPIYERDGRHVVQVKSLPPMGCAVYSIEKTATDYRWLSLAADDGSGGAVLENSRILVKINGKTGCITSFYDKINRKEWAAGGEMFGGYTYDIHGKDRIIRYLKDYAYDLEDWYLEDNGRSGYPWVSDRTYVAECCSLSITNACGAGMVAVTWKMPAESVSKYGNAPEVVMTVTIKEHSDFVDITYHINGKVETPFVESGNFVFYLNAEVPQYAIQKMGAVINPAADIQYGANTSLYCCDRWMNVSDGEHGIAFFPKDTPLLSIGENRIYVYSKDYTPQKPVLYWNAFNNQWGTNFPQWIGGDFRYQYRVYPYSGAWSDTDMPKMAEEYATPLYPLKDDRECRLLDQNIENGTVLCLKNADNGGGYILRLQENRGKAGEIRIKLAGDMRIYARCSLLEEDEEVYCGVPQEMAVKTAPFEVHTFRILKRRSKV